MMNKIAETLSRAIKEGKWVDITYKNLDDNVTHFWIAIKDIDAEEMKLKCSCFNIHKSTGTAFYLIDFNSIISAHLLFFTSYETPARLYDKLNNLDPSKIKWLKYDAFNSSVLNYYLDCNFLDCDPYQKEHYMIEGIDLDVLKKNKVFKLNDQQLKDLIQKVYKGKEKDYFSSYKELVISVFSISRDQHKYVVCYYPLTFDPTKKSLIIRNKLMINRSFLINGQKNSLYKYIDEEDMEDFIDNFKNKYDESINRIKEHLGEGEISDTRPEIMLLERNISANLEETYLEIESQYLNKELSRPLLAFFGNLTRKRGAEKKPSLVIYDDKVDIDQMRVLYNALTQSVTYVQGPPGSGKTHTILNLVLCNFISNKTMLITSSNNKPVDGIAEKLSFKYKDKDILFPYLRLGNFEEVSKSMKRILELYKYEEERKPDDDRINKILKNNEENNAILKDKLSSYERRLDLEELIASGEKLIEYFEDKDSIIIEKIKQKNDENKKELESLPVITDADLLALFKPISNDRKFLSYLYFQSLKFINKLKTEKYAVLIEICKENRPDSFNKWIGDNANLQLLLQVFPIILTTNISASKLGDTKNKFDLVVIDEAGQGNVAHALLPVARADNLLLIGDLNQLKPVIVLEDNVNENLLNKYRVDSSYDYKDNSILSVMKKHDSVSKNILLSHHYRCGKKIINFSNQRYYNSLLKTENIKEDGELVFIDVENNPQNNNNRNENKDECKQIIEYIKRNNVKDATIITPFVNQQKMMEELLMQNDINDINCGTIHSLQGAEKDTIIFSTSISPRTSKKTFEWLKNNRELINVGTTRAKKRLIVVADNEALNGLSDKSDDLYALVEYVKSNGEIIVAPSQASITIGKSNNSKAEDEFYKTISQFCSINKTFVAKRNVSFSEIFRDDKNLSKSGMEFDLVLYRKTSFENEVAVVIEINGGEHFGAKEREICDQFKREICAEKHWKFLSIPNSFVKSYEEIRELILSLKYAK